MFLVLARIKLDEEHFRTTIELEEKRNSLRQNVLSGLTEIALQSEKNFFSVKRDVEGFIKKHFSQFEDVNFLYSFIERLEQQYYVVKSEKVNINNVIKALERIQEI